MVRSAKKRKLLGPTKAWEPLRPGDIVDIVAPGFGTTPTALRAAMDFVKTIGLVPRVPKDIFAEDVISSNTDSARFRQMKKALHATDSKVVWCIRGGYGAIRIIEKIAELKPTKPKLFIGYSDAVTIHNYLNQFWGWPTLHGPVLDRLGLQNLPFEQTEALTKLLFGQMREIEFTELKPLNRQARAKGQIKSQVVGGNLTVTASVLGTSFMKVPRRQIIVFEDIGERGYKVDRLLKQLDMAGYFKTADAIIFGDFVNSLDPDGVDRVPAVIERFAHVMKIPVFSGLPVGHGDQQWALPLNTAAILTKGPKSRLKIATGAAI